MNLKRTGSSINILGPDFSPVWYDYYYLCHPDGASKSNEK